jgi:RNA recognition motif-containing protein
LLAAFLFPVNPEEAVKMEIRIYVGNLSKSTPEDEIKTLFEKAGEVTSVELVKDRESGLSKGFAFVNMTAQTEADKAISMYNAYILTGNELKVNIAKPRISKN